MRTILITGLLVLLAIVISIACGQQPVEQRPAPKSEPVKMWSYHKDSQAVFGIVEMYGHEYAYASRQASGIALVHAASCPCLKPKPVKDDKTLPPGAHILLDGNDKKPPAEKDDEK